MTKEEYIEGFGEPLRKWCISKWGDLKSAAEHLNISASLLSRYINYSTEKKPGRKFCSTIIKRGFDETKVHWLDNITEIDLDVLDKNEIKWLHLQTKKHVDDLNKHIKRLEDRIDEMRRMGYS